MNPTFFETGTEFREWLAANHATERELLVGLHKTGSGKAGLTYKQALDHALCFGWIDGVRRSLGDHAWTIRFTPRKPGSTWSMVNIARAKELIALGLMSPAGLAAFEARDESRSKQYSYEERTRPLGPPYEEQFRANDKAWEFFSAQPPSYRRTASWWIMSAKREPTRQRRLGTLIRLSAEGKRLPQFIPPRSSGQK